MKSIFFRNLKHTTHERAWAKFRDIIEIFLDLNFSAQMFTYTRNSLDVECVQLSGSEQKRKGGREDENETR